MELISKEEIMRLLIEDFYASRSRGDDERASACVLHCVEISNLPTIEERKEGKWEDAGWKGEKCSQCGWSIDDTFYSLQFLYCPNCGARMRGE